MTRDSLETAEFVARLSRHWVTFKLGMIRGWHQCVKSLQMASRPWLQSHSCGCMGNQMVTDPTAAAVLAHHQTSILDFCAALPPEEGEMNFPCFAWHDMHTKRGRMSLIDSPKNSHEQDGLCESSDVRSGEL